MPQIRVLQVMEQCNPEWPSVPLVAFRFFDGISRLVKVTLVTHERNYPALEKVRGDREIIYMPESSAIRRYYAAVARATSRGGVNWPLQHALSYPVYAQFNRSIYDHFAGRVRQGDFDVVHVLTPMLPRYPAKLIEACRSARPKVPFILGPVNGGVPFPSGFGQVARKEYAHYNFLRLFSRLLPGYATTYRQADCVLSGSTFTRDMLIRTLGLRPNRIRLFPENGVDESFFFRKTGEPAEKTPVRLLFVGRLTAYKGADMLLEAVAHLEGEVRKRVQLTLVGDGPERENLTRLIKLLNLEPTVILTGWVTQDQTDHYYRQADIFCFPSIREFGGAVVLEAMAHSLPCIVVDNGGIAEYVTPDCGFKVGPRSRDFIVEAFAREITRLVSDHGLRARLGTGAFERGRSFSWAAKAQQVVELYREFRP